MLASQCLRWGTKRSGHFRVTFTSPRGGQRDCVGLPRGSGSYNSKRSRSECPSRWTQPPPRWAEGGGAGAGVTAGRRARRPAGSEPPGCCWNGPGNRSSGTTARCSPGAAQGEEDKTNSRLPVSLTFKQGAKSPLFTAPRINWQRFHVTMPAACLTVNAAPRWLRPLPSWPTVPGSCSRGHVGSADQRGVSTTLGLPESCPGF